MTPLIDLALEVLLDLINNSAAISQLIATAKGENRDITIAELQTLEDADSAARAALVAAIAKAKAAGH